MKRIKNSIYTLPLILLCFASLTTFTISWADVTQWFSRPSWPSWTAAKQTIASWWQTLVNRWSGKSGQTQQTAIEKESVLLDIFKFNNETLKTQITKLDTHMSRYQNNTEIQQYCLDLQNKLKNVVTANDRIKILNDLKATDAKNNPELQQKIQNQIIYIDSKIIEAKRDLNQTITNDRRAPLLVIKDLYPKYASPSMEESDIYLQALNTIVVQKLSEGWFSTSALSENIHNEKVKKAVMQAMATYRDHEKAKKEQTSKQYKPKTPLQEEQTNTEMEDELEEIKRELNTYETLKGKLEYLMTQRNTYKHMAPKINILIDPIAREILSVSETATLDEIKSAHRKLALQLHPDRPTYASLSKEEKQKVAENWKPIQAAYDFLNE